MNNDKPSSESSHSPTEQPGDKETSNAITEIAHDVIKRHQTPYFAAVAAATEGIQYERTKAPALLSEVATLRSNQAELVAEIERLKYLMNPRKWITDLVLKSQLCSGHTYELSE